MYVVFYVYVVILHCFVVILCLLVSFFSHIASHSDCFASIFSNFASLCSLLHLFLEVYHLMVILCFFFQWYLAGDAPWAPESFCFSQVFFCLNANRRPYTPPTLLHSLTPSPDSVIFVLHHHKMPTYVRKKSVLQHIGKYLYALVLYIICEKSTKFPSLFPPTGVSSWKTRENVGSLVN